MAKQTGIFPLEGQIGNITFFKSKDGFMARQKGGVSAQRIASDPAFARTRENMAEFKRAGKASKLLRTALRSILMKASDGRMFNRLTSKMMEVIKLDAVNTRGQRNVIDGEVGLVDQFEFNEQGKFASSFFAPFTASIDRLTGKATVDIPPFVPANMINFPQGSTHWKLSIMAAAVNFESETYKNATAESGYGDSSMVATAATSLEADLPAGLTDPIFLVLAIEFLQEVNGVKYPLFNGTFNACAMVKTDSGV